MNLKLASPKVMAISCLPKDYLFGGAEPQTLNKLKCLEKQVRLNASI